MKEYVRGMENELYCVEFSPAFSRQFFNVVAHQAFVLFGVIVLGVETRKSLYNAKKATTAEEVLPSDLHLRAFAEHQAVDVGTVRKKGRAMG